MWGAALGDEMTWSWTAGDWPFTGLVIACLIVVVWLLVFALNDPDG